jgi:single-strand DNA-binding protein
MASYNRVVMIGNLTRDPDYKQLSSGQAVCRLGLASNRQFRNRQSGDMVQEVCYIDIDVWGPQAESCKQYLAKGRQVLIEGRIKFDTWQDQESGTTRSKHSIVADRVVFLSSGADNGEVSAGASAEPESFEPRNEVERELMSQLDGIKARAKQPVASPVKEPARKKSAESFDQAGPATGAAMFKDEPPFKDDLPF